MGTTTCPLTVVAPCSFLRPSMRFAVRWWFLHLLQSNLLWALPTSPAWVGLTEGQALAVSTAKLPVWGWVMYVVWWLVVSFH